MLLVTLLAVLSVAVVVGVFVYAVHTAADGREDEAGFHYATADQHTHAASSVQVHADTARS